MDGTVLAIIGAGCSVIIAGSVVLGFWMRFENRLTVASSRADAAEKAVAEAKVLAADAHNRVTLLQAEFGLYRESVAREYIHREAMREIEDRLTAAIDRLGDRFDKFMSAQYRAKTD